MDAFQLLKADHRKVAQLFDQLESANGKAKLEVFQQIQTELELHTHIEETIFYPALEQPKPTHDLTLEAYEEHDVVKKLLAELSRARNPTDEWEAQAKVLRENVEHHVEEEEGELFSKAEDVLSQDDIEDLGDRMAAEKQRQQGRQATKTRSAGKKAAKGSKKSAGAAKKSAKGGAKKAGRSSKKAAKKASKKGGARKSASQSASRSTAAKTTRKSRSKKSAAKKR
jgi:hemerythrin-like domain-containing protein